MLMREGLAEMAAVEAAGFVDLQVVVVESLFDSGQVSAKYMAAISCQEIYLTCMYT